MKRALLAAILLSGCGSEASAPAPTPTPAPSPSPSPSPSPEANPAPTATGEPSPSPTPSVPAAPAAAPSAEVAVAPEALPSNGLPPITSGPAIHVESTFPVTTREVGSRRLQSVTLPNPAAQTALDAWFEDKAYCRGRVSLAIEGFVSYPCTYSEPAAGAGEARMALNAAIAPDGTVRNVAPEEIWLPGTNVREMLHVFADGQAEEGETFGAHRAGVGGFEIGEAAFGTNGLVIVPSDMDFDLVRVPWRRVAPYVRADGPLGPALIAAGLTLAPPGTAAPPMPPRVPAIVARSVGHSIAVAAKLPAAMRAGSRLGSSGDATVVLLPTGADASQASDAASGLQRVDRYLYGSFAEIVSVRVTEALELHESAGPRAPIVGAVPAGAVTVAARGPIGARASELGTGWTLLAGPRDIGGFAQGRNVALLEGCGAPAPPAEGPRPLLSGYVDLTPEQRFAWVITPSDEARVVIALFPAAADCSIGPQARRVDVEGAVTAIRIVPVAEGSSDWLTIVVTAPDFTLPARRVDIFGPESDVPPIHTSTVDAPVVRLAERRGPDRAAGYFPVTIQSGDTRTYLTWDGTTIVPLAPPTQ